VARVLRTPRIGGGARVAFAGKGAVEGSITWNRTGTARGFDGGNWVEASAADAGNRSDIDPFRSKAVAKRVGRSHIGHIGNQTKVRRHYAARPIRSAESEALRLSSAGACGMHLADCKMGTTTT
jgi:hypothetical protein